MAIVTWIPEELEWVAEEYYAILSGTRLTDRERSSLFQLYLSAEARAASRPQMLFLIMWVNTGTVPQTIPSIGSPRWSVLDASGTTFRLGTQGQVRAVPGVPAFGFAGAGAIRLPPGVVGWYFGRTGWRQGVPETAPGFEMVYEDLDYAAFAITQRRVGFSMPPFASPDIPRDSIYEAVVTKAPWVTKTPWRRIVLADPRVLVAAYLGR